MPKVCIRRNQFDSHMELSIFSVGDEDDSYLLSFTSGCDLHNERLSDPNVRFHFDEGAVGIYNQSYSFFAEGCTVGKIPMHPYS